MGTVGPALADVGKGPDDKEKSRADKAGDVRDRGQLRSKSSANRSSLLTGTSEEGCFESSSSSSLEVAT